MISERQIFPVLGQNIFLHDSGPEKKGENDFMAHYCECRRRIVVKSRARHARAGWIYRPGHDLCRKCWRSLVEGQAMRSIELTRSRFSVLYGFDSKAGVKDFSLALAFLRYKASGREARVN
jgi:hypothetical protein